MSDLDEMLAAVRAITGQREQTEDASPERVKELLAAMAVKHDFKPGDLIQWKPGLKNRTFPEAGQSVVVTDVLAESICPNSNREDQFFRQPEDIAFATIVDSELCIFYAESRRFEPYTGE